jgi:hypothetical protein
MPLMGDVWREVYNLIGPILANHLGKAEPPVFVPPNSLLVRFRTPFDFDREH